MKKASGWIDGAALFLALITLGVIVGVLVKNFLEANQGGGASPSLI